MPLKVFSKRHPEAAREVVLKQSVRQRIWYVIEEYDSYYYPDSFNNYTLCWDALPERLKKEHGWQELRAYKSRDEWEKVKINDFILKGVHRFVLDAVELFHDLLLEDKERDHRSSSSPTRYQSELNIIFEDANLPWRMLDGRIIKVDSKWLEAEIHSKAAELMDVRGFEGALAEFQQARSDLSSGDYKGAIHASNLALESTIKGILNVEYEKPGTLYRKLIDSGLVPEYHAGFLKAFEEHIIRSVALVRNFEKGVGHGQGYSVNDPPKSLAELAVNLAGVLILYLLKRHMELHPVEADPMVEPEAVEDEILF